MDAYSIFTVCTRNYRDASDFSIDSWLATKARHIYVYTDDPTWVAKTDRISILPVFSASDSWLINVGHKARAFRRILDETPCENVVFLDADCYVWSEIGGVFEKDFDLAVTRFLKGVTISSGIWFSRNNQRTKDFTNAWLKKQDEFNPAPTGSRHRIGSSYSQNSFDHVLRQVDRDRVCRILKLSYNMYSLKVKDRSKLSKAKALIIKKLLMKRLCEKPNILHFYNNSYRNEQLKKEVFEALEEIHDERET